MSPRRRAAQDNCFVTACSVRGFAVKEFLIEPCDGSAAILLPTREANDILDYVKNTIGASVEQNDIAPDDYPFPVVG
jgi:hypothetical protein